MLEMKSLLFSFGFYLFLSSSLLAVCTEKEGLGSLRVEQEALKPFSDELLRTLELGRKIKNLELKKSRLKSDQMLSKAEERRIFFQKSQKELKEWEGKMKSFQEEFKKKIKEFSCEDAGLGECAESSSEVIFTEKEIQDKMMQYELFKKYRSEDFFHD